MHEELSGQPKSRVPASVMLPLAVSLDAVVALRSVTVVLVEFKLAAPFTVNVFVLIPPRPRMPPVTDTGPVVTLAAASNVAPFVMPIELPSLAFTEPPAT